MLYRISVTERGLTGIANIFRSRLSRLDDLLGAGTVPLMHLIKVTFCAVWISLQFRSQIKHFFCARNYMLKVFKERALSFEVL